MPLDAVITTTLKVLAPAGLHVLPAVLIALHDPSRSTAFS